jgi:hypothetical protein
MVLDQVLSKCKWIVRVKNGHFEKNRKAASFQNYLALDWQNCYANE